jgi:hypothetical protein
MFSNSLKRPLMALGPIATEPSLCSIFNSDLTRLVFWRIPWQKEQPQTLLDFCRFLSFSSSAVWLTAPNYHWDRQAVTKDRQRVWDEGGRSRPDCHWHRQAVTKDGRAERRRLRLQHRDRPAVFRMALSRSTFTRSRPFARWSRWPACYETQLIWGLDNGNHAGKVVSLICLLHSSC